MMVALLRNDTLRDHSGDLEDPSYSQLYRTVESGRGRMSALHPQDEAEFEDKPLN